MEFKDSDGSHERRLSGGYQNDVTRVGDTVRRPTSFWSPAVHELLVKLHRSGFVGAPRFIGTDYFGREILPADGVRAGGPTDRRARRR